jgi:hypothetical protein
MSHVLKLTCRPLLSNPQVGVGNHESWYNWTSVKARFQMPTGTTSGSEPPFWYSMTNGLVHWTMLCSEFPLDAASPQGQWLAADLAAAAAPDARGVHPWVVVTIHRPPYSSDASWLDIRAELEPVLSRYKVDLVVNGHMHAYERTHPVGDNGNAVTYPDPAATAAAGHDVYVSPAYPVYLTQGNAGAGQEERFESPAPAWSAVRWANGRDFTASAEQAAVGAAGSHRSYTDTFGFGVARFINATALQYESVPVTGSFSDVFTITRPVPVVV